MNLVSLLLGLGFLVSELSLARWRRSSRVGGSSDKDDGSLRRLWRFITAAIVAGALLAAFGVGPRLPGLFPWWTVSLGTFLFGTILRWWAIRHLGRFFTVDVAMASDHRLIDTGPYRRVRHPSYTGLIFQFTGLALAFGNTLTCFVILIPVFFALSDRIRIEERALAANFGAEYDRYARRTKRLVPLLY